LTALENVQLITEIAANPMSAEEALEMVGLKERLNHFPAQFSGGEQQRVAIARAIAKRPEVLLCDEPTGALDYITGKIVLEVIEFINRELVTTTAVITHNAPIAQMDDRVIHIGSGQIVSIEQNKTKARPADLVW
jgi:putative ABC transport system ATP-binding protein